MSNQNEEIMKMLQIAAFNNKQVSEQMGLMVKKVSDMEGRLEVVEDRMQKYEDRVRVSRSQAQEIRNAIHRRVDQILHIEHKGGVVSDASIGIDAKYKDGFICRCYKDARDNSRLGTPYYETLTRDFDETMEYIEGWRPNVEGGVEGYKKYLDIRREEKNNQ